MYQVILNDNQLILSNSNKALPNAKIEVLDPVTLLPIDVYEYTGNEYVPTTNSITLDVFGRPKSSYFTKQLAYLRLSDQGVFIRDWLAGFSVDSAVTSEVYLGINAIKKANTSLGTITVQGYHSSDDAMRRNYTWHQGCSLPEDGGYIIASDIDSTGRWILDYDLAIIPSIFYGVTSTSTSNINALLGMPESINGKYTPGIIWMQPGEYHLDTQLNTAKTLLVTGNTSFDQIVACYDAIVLSNGRVADFKYTSKNAKARSDNFLTLQGLLTSNASKIVYNGMPANAKRISKVVKVKNANIESSEVLSAQYDANCYILVDNCKVSGKLFSLGTDYVACKNCEVSDWFSYTNSNAKFNIGRTELEVANHTKHMSAQIGYNTWNMASKLIMVNLSNANLVETVNLLGGTVNIEYANLENIKELANGEISTNSRKILDNVSLRNITSKSALTLRGIYTLDKCTLGNVVLEADQAYINYCNLSSNDESSLNGDYYICQSILMMNLANPSMDTARVLSVLDSKLSNISTNKILIQNSQFNKLELYAFDSALDCTVIGCVVADRICLMPGSSNNSLDKFLIKDTAFTTTDNTSLGIYCPYYADSDRSSKYLNENNIFSSRFVNNTSIAANIPKWPARIANGNFSVNATIPTYEYSSGISAKSWKKSTVAYRIPCVDYMITPDTCTSTNTLAFRDSRVNIAVQSLSKQDNTTDDAFMCYVLTNNTQLNNDEYTWFC